MAALHSGDPFRLDLPDGWEDLTVYHFRHLSEDGEEHLLQMILHRHIQHQDVERFAREKTDPIVSTLQGIEVLKDEETTIPTGNPVYEFVYRWLPSEEMRIYKKFVFVIKDGMGYTFQCEFSRKSLKTVGLRMKEVIEGIVPGTYRPINRGDGRWT